MKSTHRQRRIKSRVRFKGMSECSTLHTCSDTHWAVTAGAPELARVHTRAHVRGSRSRSCC
eukprot:103597-Chlamydomonas_euryale.AAC.3